MQDKKKPQLQELVSRLNGEVNLLEQVVEERGDYYDKDYADKLIRSELEQINDLLDNTKGIVGEGEAISFTPSTQDE